MLNVSEQASRQSTKDELLEMLRKMLTIRRFEERVVKEFEAGRVKGFVHAYIGEEAVAVGICSALHEDDYITSTHRGHGHCIAKGVDVKSMMAELFGRRTGVCKGKGGSMHIADLSMGMLGANGIVGGGIPIANGAALSAKYRKSGQVAVAFFGDGGLNQGSFHETLNLASILKLPILFVCENNQYAESTPVKYATSVRDPTVRAASYGIPAVRVDGMDVVKVHEAAVEAVSRARNDEGPTMLVCDTYRYRGHFEGDDQTYRTNVEVEEWKSKDPIVRLKNQMTSGGMITEEEYLKLEKSVMDEIDESVEYADNSPWPNPEEALEDVFTNIER